MKRVDSPLGWEAASPVHEGNSVHPMSERSGPQWDRLRYHFATAVDELTPGSDGLPSTEDPQKVVERAPADQDIVAKATQRLQTSGYRALRAIQCECEQGILRLRGGVNSFFHLQLAQELVRGIEGVDEFLIDVRVANVDVALQD